MNLLKIMVYQTELSNVNLNDHQCKHRRQFRRDRQPTRIPIRSLKNLRNKSRKVRKFVFERILSCIPMPSSVYVMLCEC